MPLCPVWRGERAAAERGCGLRRASGHVRLLTIDALSALTGLAESLTLTHDQVVSVLRPASALADTTVALLHSRLNDGDAAEQPSTGGS